MMVGSALCQKNRHSQAQVAYSWQPRSKQLGRPPYSFQEQRDCLICPQPGAPGGVPPRGSRHSKQACRRPSAVSQAEVKGRSNRAACAGAPRRRPRRAAAAARPRWGPPPPRPSPGAGMPGSALGRGREPLSAAAGRAARKDQRSAVARHGHLAACGACCTPVKCAGVWFQSQSATRQLSKSGRLRGAKHAPQGDHATATPQPRPGARSASWSPNRDAATAEDAPVSAEPSTPERAQARSPRAPQR